MGFTEILGYAAGFVTTLTFLPQVIKTWKEKSSKDISLMMFLIAAANEIMWVAYGILKNDMVIILTNVVVLLLSSIMITLKLKYK
jgi:MtN3 and saliva related transmembrane protein